MIRLCGFALSNYYNKVKFVLLEHGIEFEEVFVQPSQDEAVVAHSLLGLVTYMQTEDGDLCELFCFVVFRVLVSQFAKRRMLYDGLVLVRLY